MIARFFCLGKRFRQSGDDRFDKKIDIMAKHKRYRGRKDDSPLRLNLNAVNDDSIDDSNVAPAVETVGESHRRHGLKQYWWAVGVIALLALGAFGAGMKYLEQSAKEQRLANAGQLATDSKDQSLLSKVNPFTEAPMPSATPQLSKEYIYAGSRMLAVEDANASAAPPADLAVWRQSTGYWYVMGGTGSQATSYQWGGSGDKEVPGDYDGDGKTDFSVFRASNGTWYVTRSSDNSNFAYTFGQTGDIVAPADYDGDGKTDVAVYRAGNWYIQRSSDQTFVGIAYGSSSDIPAPADYDGDGKADLSIWRSADKTFYTLKSSTNYTTSETATMPQASSAPVSADYDGDGKADYAIRYNSDWIIRNSSSGTVQTAVPWYSASDTAVQNDYDGDGKVDIAVWNAASGNWYIRQSSLNGQLRQVQWGGIVNGTADIPVPAYYRR